MFDDIPVTNKNKASTTPQGGGALSFDDIPRTNPKVRGASNMPALIKAIDPENINKPTFEYDKNDSTLTKVATAVGNVPKSIWNIGKGIASAVASPVETVKNIGKLVGGTVAVGAEKVIENTDLGQRFLDKANQSRISRGLAPLKVDADGKLQAEDTEEMTMAKNVGGYFKERYGGLDNIQRTAVEDPAGIALDVSALFTGGSTLAPKVAKVAEVAGMAKTANTISRAGVIAERIGSTIDPIRQSARVIAPVVKRKLGGLSDVISKSGKELQSDALKEGLYGMNETVGTLKQKFENTSYKYKSPAGEIIDVNPIDTLVQYDLIPQPARGGSLDVSGIKAKLPSLKRDIEGKISTILKTDGKTISIDDYATQLENSIAGLDKSQLEKTKLAKKIDSELDSLKEAYPDGQIPLDEINKIRKEANGEFREDKVDFARVTGNATREIVYNATPDLAVKDLLNEQRKLINAEDYANKLSIHKVKGGRLGNYVYTTLGAIVGGATKLPFGVGETVGAVGGRALSELLQRRQLRSIPADLKAGIEKVIGGGPMTVDVKSGIEKLLGNQKSPKSNPQSNTANTTANIDNIIPERKTEVNTPKNINLDKHGTPVNADTSLSDPIEGGVYYHGTIKENKPSLLKEGFNINSNKKGFAEQPEAFYIGGYGDASMYGDDLVGVKVKVGQKVKTLSMSNKEWADTVGKSKNSQETAQALREIRARGYDAINSGNEIEILNPSKFEIFDTTKEKTLYEQVTGKKQSDYKKPQ